MRRTFTLGALLFIATQLRAAEIPAPLAPLVDTIERCERFAQLTRAKGWKTIYRQTFDTLPEKEIELVAPKMVGGPKFISHVKGESSSLKIDVTAVGNTGLVQIGPSVRGEFAIEMRAMAVSPRLCDLSIMTDGVAKSVGFQFGANDNTRNILWLGSDGANVPSKEGDNSLLIKPKTWHTIRLEVRRDRLAGIVDGRTLVTAPPAKKHNFNAELKPMIYVYGSAATIDEYRVDVPDDSVAPDAADKAWTDAFVRKTRADVNADLAKLAGHLADPDYATRQAAYDLLARAGVLAKDVLRPLIKTGPLESRERAKSLLRLIGESIPDDAPDAEADKPAN